MPVQPVLLLHGGLGTRAPRGEKREAIVQSLNFILAEVYPKLLRGMSALDAVTRACALLEDDPLYNAGKGSKIQSDGKIRLSASIMDGERRRFGGCVNVEGLKNPIFLARELLKKKDRVLSGEGARRYARELGLKFASPYTEHQLAAYRKKKRGKNGTVGAVALDSRGRLAAATSTGGKGFEYPFRVSDSPTSAGNFANELCAVSCTGTGEEIVEQAAASTLCAFMEAGMSLEKAMDALLKRSNQFNAEFGMIAVDHRGNFLGSRTKCTLVWAAASKKGFQILD